MLTVGGSGLGILQESSLKYKNISKNKKIIFYLHDFPVISQENIIKTRNVIELEWRHLFPN